MSRPRIAILHYSAPPVVGGVETVIAAHVKLFEQSGYPTTVIAGRGAQEALHPQASFLSFSEIDSLHTDIKRIGASLEQGIVPQGFNQMVARLSTCLSPVLDQFDHIIIHNVLTKHFNLPLTAALHEILDQGFIRHCVAWCHDITWTSPNSRSKVHPGYPWDLIRTQRSDVEYVVVSQLRQRELSGLFGCPLDQIEVIYNGVEPSDLLGLSPEGLDLIHRLDLLNSELNLLMPVRVTQAKNLEYALRVVAVLKARGLQLKLVLTGPPDPHEPQSLEYFRYLKLLRKQLGVEEEMHFVYEMGLDPDQPYIIDSRVVGDLFRICDVLFMPSHREGFGMPVIEAGLVGVPVVSTSIPAAVEINDGEILFFDEKQEPEKTADQILQVVEKNPISRLRRNVRRNFTWEAIFRRRIEPLFTS